MVCGLSFFVIIGALTDCISAYPSPLAYIEGVRSVLDPNPMPPGLYQYSVIVSTPQREMKITAPTKERHDIWLNASRRPFASYGRCNTDERLHRLSSTCSLGLARM